MLTLFAEPANFKVERNGFVESVLLSWDVPRLALFDSSLNALRGKEGYYQIQNAPNGAKSVKWDGGYNVSLKIVDLRSNKTLLSNSSKLLVAADGFPQSLAVTLPYGEYALYDFAWNVSFENITYSNGKIGGDASVWYKSTILYRQPDDTESWGSPNQKVLYWYWQDTR